MLVGRWEALPLRTLERALLDNKIADPDTLKVGLIIFKAFDFKELSTLYVLRCPMWELAGRAPNAPRGTNLKLKEL